MSTMNEVGSFCNLDISDDLYYLGIEQTMEVLRSLQPQNHVPDPSIVIYLLAPDVPFDCANHCQLPE